MKWSSAVSVNESLEESIAECASAIRDDMGELKPDLVVAFVSPHHAADYENVPHLIKESLGECLLLGCSGNGVIGAGQEVEHRPGFAMTAAHLPGVELSPFHIEDSSLPDGDAAPDSWEMLVSMSADKDPQFVLLADPFSIRSEPLLMGLDYAFPGSIKIGGLASGASQPGENALYLSDSVHRSGVVGIAMLGNVAVDAIVCQGCRPIGSPMQVTECSQNTLSGLDGRTPVRDT